MVVVTFSRPAGFSLLSVNNASVIANLANTWRTVRFSASPEYLKLHGVPQRPEDLDAHKLILFGQHHPPVSDVNWLAEAGRRPGNLRRALLEVNSTQAVLLAIRSGLGIGALPDFVVAENPDLVRILPDLKGPKVEVYFVYPEELRNSKRVAVFRDFLLARLTTTH